VSPSQPDDLFVAEALQSYGAEFARAVELRDEPGPRVYAVAGGLFKEHDTQRVAFELKAAPAGYVVELRPDAVALCGVLEQCGPRGQVEAGDARHTLQRAGLLGRVQPAERAPVKRDGE
jgi:hypothetical protein